MRNLTVILRDYEIRILELGDRVRSTKRHSRGGGSSLLPYRKPTPSGEPVRLIRPETAHACMTHETQKRPQLSVLWFEIYILPITITKSVRCSQLSGSVVLFKFDISFRILTTVLFRATLKYIFLLHVACLLVKITCISVPVAIACV